jgi:hypothetical protein
VACGASAGVLESSLQTCSGSPHQIRPHRRSLITMSTRYNDGSHYENHPQAAELHDLASHAHRVAEEHGKQEHLTGHEQSRQAHEHSADSQQPGHDAATVGHGIAAFGHSDIAALAYELWQSRGCPDGSPEEDWFRAAQQLRSRAHTS